MKKMDEIFHAQFSMHNNIPCTMPFITITSGDGEWNFLLEICKSYLPRPMQGLSEGGGGKGGNLPWLPNYRGPQNVQRGGGQKRCN